MKHFAEKVVVVTGAGIGIGFEICRRFALAGATVALNDIDSAVAVSAVEKINAEVGVESVFSYGLDVADVAAVRTMISQVAERFGRLDVVVANAGITNYGPFLSYSPEAFDRISSVNLRGSYFTAQAAAQTMIEQRSGKAEGGRILLLSSVTGLRAFKNLSAYGMTKAAICHMARALAGELGEHGITVNAIAPGATLTERTLADDPQYERNWAGVTPTGQVGHVEDIANTTLFLASPEARQITGQTIVVDGGWTLSSPLPDEHPEQPEFSSQLR